MIFYKGHDYADVSRKAANIISAQIIMKPNCVLGLATGSSPIGAYNQLIDWYNKGDLDFSKVSTVNLDEYKGLSGDNDQSYRYFMNKYLFDHVNIDKANTNVPNGLEEDEKVECARYDQVIQNTGGVDLQLLGIGRNGHIGFNEPNDTFQIGTHCVKLAESTIEANARLFNDPSEVPHYAYTMGIKNIIQAKKIVVVVSGEDKADAVAQAFFGPVTSEVQASILQFHNDVVVIGDEAAFSKINV